MAFTCLLDAGVDVMVPLTIYSCRGLDWPPGAPTKMNAGEVTGGGLGLQPPMCLS
jgi:hypothetical protein